ncbi:MAG: hypothetical protein JXA89_01385, partial [Anaerolineae bacterium]|nr:hypothetical protein [Anaerolineae bacterium]
IINLGKSALFSRTSYTSPQKAKHLKFGRIVLTRDPIWMNGRATGKGCLFRHIDQRSTDARSASVFWGIKAECNPHRTKRGDHPLAIDVDQLLDRYILKIRILQ